MRIANLEQRFHIGSLVFEARPSAVVEALQQEPLEEDDDRVRVLLPNAEQLGGTDCW